MGATRASSTFFPVASERFDRFMGRSERDPRGVDGRLRGGMPGGSGREQVRRPLNVTGRRSKIGFMHHALFCGESVERRTACNFGPPLGDEQRLLGTTTIFFGFTFNLLDRFQRGGRRVTGSHTLGEEEVGQVHVGDRTGVGDGGPNANPC